MAALLFGTPLGQFVLASTCAIMRSSSLLVGSALPALGLCLSIGTNTNTTTNSSHPLCHPSIFQPLLPASFSAVVLSATPVPAGSSYGEGSADLPYPTNPSNLPALCAVLVNVTTSETSNYRFELFLPDAWNARFLAVGNGGFAGGINWLDMGAGVRYGHAVVSTDTGHNSSTSGSSWALNNPGRRADFGWRAMHGTVELGKMLVEGYYSQRIKYSYYSGSSTGGRQGLREAMVDAASFDGMVITAPAWWTSHLQPWTTRVGKLNLPVTAEYRVNASMFDVIGAEVTRQCDALDGVSDGIVSAPDNCTFSTDPLLCTAPGANASACLTAAQAATVKEFYADYYAEGKFAFPGFSLSSESQWTPLLGGSSPNNLGDGYLADFLLDDPSFTWAQYNDTLLWYADATNPGNATAQYYDALSAYARRGGKLILTHGMADGLIATGSSVVFHQRILNATITAGINPADWLFFALVPGMQHVDGTAVDAPWYYAQGNGAGTLGTDVYSVPGFADVEHDALLAVMEWAEKGRRVERIVATTWTDATDVTSGVRRQRPLCAWPKVQTYDGSGDPDVVGSWVCA